MPKIFGNLEHCTGCRACEQSCPLHLISMREDENGFIYPHMDSDQCVECGICDRACHCLSKRETHVHNCACYGWHRDENIRMASSSGGAFTAIVQTFADENTKIYGAAFNEDNNYVCHQRTDLINYQKLRKSKYVFCDTMKSYTQVKQDLNNGLKVIYTGTPCQIAGLKQFLNRENENLLTIDFICHGVPSMKLLNAHINNITKNGKVEDVDFRSKHFGWRRHCLKVHFLSGKLNTTPKEYVKKIEEDLYLNAFMKYTSLRLSCYSCENSIEHSSDITLADFWRIGELKPELKNCNGASLIISNTPVGEKCISKLEKVMNIWSIEQKYYNYVYTKHDKYPTDNREKFYNNVKSYKYTKLLNDFRLKCFKSKIVSIVKNIIGKNRIKQKWR